MAKFKTTMNADRFKKAVHALPADPSEGEEFQALRATKDGDKEHTYVGLYIGTSMRSDFTKDKGIYQKPTLFKGTLRRSAKHPTKKLVLESTGSLPPLKELGKECLKAVKLALVIVTMQPGEPEPEPTAEELAEMGLDTTDAAHASDAPQTPARPAAGAPTPPAAVAPRPPLPGIAPTPKTPTASPPPATSVTPVRPATQHADVPGQQKASSKKDAEFLLKVGNQLRVEWGIITNEGLETDSILIAKRNAVLAALKKQEVKPAVQAMLELQHQIPVARAERDASRRQLVRNWLFRQKGDPRYLLDDPETAIDTGTIGLPKAGAMLAAEYDMPVETAMELLGTEQKSMMQEMAATTKEFVPEGFKFASKLISPLVPDEARPKLTLDEAQAIFDYAAATYDAVNRPLWTNTVPPPPHDETHRRLQAAFKKTKPFPKPVRVERGLDFNDPAKLAAFLKPFQDSLGTDELVPLMGYISTGTTGVPLGFAGNVQFTILAKQGIDVTPYAYRVVEKELLLNHGTPVKVHSCRLEGSTWKLTVEQIVFTPRT